jgi:hypothetical protein
MEVEPAHFDLPTAIENALILVRERGSRPGITLVRAIQASPAAEVGFLNERVLEELLR